MTKIRWTDQTWNPVTGCTKVSEGCQHCYAETLALGRLAGKVGYPGLPWTRGNEALNVTMHPNRLRQPLSWKVPSRVFVNSMADLFHHLVPSEFLDSVWDVMLALPQHTYQILTKRPERMAEWVLGWLERTGRDEVPANIWLGTSIELDRWTHRADHLRRIPVPVRFLSCEPLLGPLPSLDLSGLSWVIVGGESGPDYRPMDHDWARDLRDRCADQGIAFYFKQSAARWTERGMDLDGERIEQYPGDDGFPIRSSRGGPWEESTRGPLPEGPSPAPALDLGL